MSNPSLLVRAVMRYDALLKSWTLTTSSISTMGLYAIGDYVTQIFIEKQRHCKHLREKGWWYPDLER